MLVIKRRLFVTYSHFEFVGVGAIIFSWNRDGYYSILLKLVRLVVHLIKPFLHDTWKVFIMSRSLSSCWWLATKLPAVSKLMQPAKAKLLVHNGEIYQLVTMKTNLQIRQTKFDNIRPTYLDAVIQSPVNVNNTWNVTANPNGYNHRRSLNKTYCKFCHLLRHIITKINAKCFPSLLADIKCWWTESQAN